VSTVKDKDEALEKVEQRIIDKYGEILTTKEIAEVLRFPTADAVTKAHQQGRLPISLTQFSGRRGFYTSAACIAKALYEFMELEKTITNDINEEGGEDGIKAKC